MTVRIILADDHPMARAGLAFWLGQKPNFKLVAEAQDGPEAWCLVQEHLPDVLLLDIDMPGESGVSVTKRIRAAGLKVGVLMLTSYKAQQYVLASLRAGATGFILKTAPLEELEEAIFRTARGELYLDTKLSVRSPDDLAQKELSSREREVLLLTAQGLSGKDTAERLGISERTIEAHLSSIYNKLGARNKTESIILTLKSGVLLLEELNIADYEERSPLL